MDPNAINKAQQQRRTHSAGGPSYPKPSSARAHQRAALLVSPSQCLGSQYRPALPPAANQDLAILGSAGALQCPIHPHAFFPTLPLPGGARLGLCLLSLSNALGRALFRTRILGCTPRTGTNTCSPTTPAAPPPSQAAPHATGEAIDCVSEDGVIGTGASSASTSAKRPRPESKKAVYLRSLLDFMGASSSGLSPA